MAQKKFVNNTSYEIQGTLEVRAGDQPGTTLNAVNFVVAPNSSQMVTYGDASNPYMDALQISGVTNGAVVLTDQIVIGRSSELDNLFNMNDTIYIAMNGQNFNVTSGNTWTT